MIMIFFHRMILNDTRRLLVGTLVMILLVSTYSTSAYAASDYCSTAAINLNKLSAAGELQYKIQCEGLDVESAGFVSGDGFVSPESIQSVGPNTKITADPAGPSGIPNTQSEVSLDSCGNSVVVGYNDAQGFFATSSFSGYSYSLDNGLTWTDAGVLPTPPGGFSFGDPSVKADSNCDFYYATLTSVGGDSGIGVAKSTNGGVTFGAPVIVASTLTNFLDKELIAVGPNPAGGQDIIHISYTEFTISGAAAIVYARSLDGGVTWQDFNTLNPGGSSQGSIPVADPSTGDVYVFYQDFAAGTIKVFKNTNGGAPGFWQGGVDVSPLNFAGTFNAFCGRPVWNGDHRINQFPTAGVNPVNGDVYVAWNNGAFNGDPTTDIVFFRSTDGGTTWLGPISPHPALATTDQFEPWMDVAPDGEIKMIWYDRRDDPSSNLDTDVFASSSNDGGQTWQPNVKVTTTPFTMGVLTPYQDPLIVPCYFVGEYIGIDVPNISFAHAAWGDGRILTTDGIPQPDVFYSKLIQKVNEVVGGEFLPVDSTALVLAGIQTSSVWILSIFGLVAGVTFATLFFKVKRI